MQRGSSLRDCLRKQWSISYTIFTKRLVMIWDKAGPQDTFATPDILRADVRLFRMTEYVMSPERSNVYTLKECEEQIILV